MCEFDSITLDPLDELDIFSSILFSSDFNDYDPPPLNNNKPMIEWKTDDVIRFIDNEVSLFCIEDDQEEKAKYFQRFQSFSGYIFSHLSEDKCQLVAQSKSIGTAIYKAKELYLRNEQNTAVNCDNNFDNSCDNNQPIITFNQDSGDSIIGNTPRRPGRPRSSKSSIKNKTGKRSQKLWEFIIHLLQDGNTCPHLIKWDNFEEGTFKFVQSDKVARLWGSRKKNDNMTYEKFSRAMRYYYKSKVLLPVPGRRLVYKFGPKAKGWRTVSANH